MGYPLKLAAVKYHWFARWEVPHGRAFNIECTSRGFNSYPDAQYLTWPALTNYDEVNQYGFLRSKSPKQELAAFVACRGHCLLENQRYREAVEAYALARELEPDNWLQLDSAVAAIHRWHKYLKQSGPPPVLNHCDELSWPVYRSIPFTIQKGMRFLDKWDLDVRVALGLPCPLLDVFGAPLTTTLKNQVNYEYDPLPVKC
jgi:hypothetical protein